MDYNRLLQRSWNIVIQNPYLFLLGILIALTSSNASSGSSYRTSDQQMEQLFSGTPFAEQFDALAGVAIAAVIGLMCLAFLVFLVLWVVQQVARGALIAGVDEIDEERVTSLGDAWRAGWHRKWTLLGIGLVLLIPVLLLIGLGVLGLFFFFSAALGRGDLLSTQTLAGGTIAGILAVFCVVVPIALLLTLWSEFAYRACMLEGTGVVDSFGRGWRVLFDNVGPVVIIVLIRVGVGIVLILPSLVGSLCCLLWPILLVLQGAVTTYFSTVWTLAWKEFTAVPGEPVRDMPKLT